MVGEVVRVGEVGLGEVRSTWEERVLLLRWREHPVRMFSPNSTCSTARAGAQVALLILY